MRLARLCEHDEMSPHPMLGGDGTLATVPWCGGGEFLTDDTLEAGAFAIALFSHQDIESTLDWECETEEFRQFYRDQVTVCLDALTVREGAE